MTEQKFGLIYGLTNPYFDGVVGIVDNVCLRPTTYNL